VCKERTEQIKVKEAKKGVDSLGRTVEGRGEDLQNAVAEELWEDGWHGFQINGGGKLGICFNEYTGF